MPVQLRMLVGFSGPIDGRTFTSAVQEFIPQVGFVTQETFVAGSVLDATGQAKDYMDENYPDNIGPLP